MNISLKDHTRFAPAWAQNIERIPVPHPTWKNKIKEQEGQEKP